MLTIANIPDSLCITNSPEQQACTATVGRVYIEKGDHVQCWSHEAMHGKQTLYCMDRSNTHMSKYTHIKYNNSNVVQK